MAAPQGKVRVHQEAETVTFQVMGWGRMYQSMPIRRLGEQCLAEGATTLRVDLRHCTYIDSTFLGTLLYLKRVMHRKGQGQFLLLSPSPECCRLFQQLGVADCLPAVAGEEPAQAAWNEVPCEAEDVETFNRNVVQAHQELANLGGRCGEAFGAVARGLAKDHDPGKTP